MNDAIQKPTVGRIIHVFLENGQIRPAMITRVGPALVGEADTGQVAYEILLAPEDGRFYQGAKQREGHQRNPNLEWKAGDWIWPPRV